MADEDEDDYMSDKFLLGSDDKRPGLPILNRVSKKYNKEEKHRTLNEKNRVKPLREREKERREEGMASAIGSSNIGFAMLKKMGYKQGTGLGKEGTGRSDPIPISIKADRGGLGRETAVKRQKELRETIREEIAKKRTKLEQRQREHFRQHNSNKFAEKQIESDLYKSQKACEQLDKKKDLPCQEVWYWPEEKKDEDENIDEEDVDDEDDDDEQDDTLLPQEKLVQLTSYLRTKHLYCIWCGTTYNDQEDLEGNCPGDTSDAHD